jgi:hypothetical protein
MNALSTSHIYQHSSYIILNLGSDFDLFELQMSIFHVGAMNVVSYFNKYTSEQLQHGQLRDGKVG